MCVCVCGVAWGAGYEREKDSRRMFMEKMVSRTPAFWVLSHLLFCRFKTSMLNKKILSPLITKMLNDDCNWLIIRFFLYIRVCA